MNTNRLSLLGLLCGVLSLASASIEIAYAGSGAPNPGTTGQTGQQDQLVQQAQQEQLEQELPQAVQQVKSYTKPAGPTMPPHGRLNQGYTP